MHSGREDESAAMVASPPSMEGLHTGKPVQQWAACPDSTEASLDQLPGKCAHLHFLELFLKNLQLVFKCKRDDLFSIYPISTPSVPLQISVLCEKARISLF